MSHMTPRIENGYVGAIGKFSLGVALTFVANGFDILAACWGIWRGINTFTVLYHLSEQSVISSCPSHENISQSQIVYDCCLFQGSGALSSGGSEFQAEDACSNSSSQDRDSPSNCLSPGPLPSAPPSFGRPLPPSNLSSHPQPLSLSTFDLDRLSDEHLRAKRARVENIIRGMSHSPLVRPSTGDHSQESNRDNANEHREDSSSHGHRRSDCASSLLSSPASRAGGVNAGEAYRENKRKQRLPQQQHSFTQLVCSRQEQRQEERRQLKLQLEDMQVGHQHRWQKYVRFVFRTNVWKDCSERKSSDSASAQSNRVLTQCESGIRKHKSDS